MNHDNQTGSPLELEKEPTYGQRLAEEMRAECNALSDEEREALDGEVMALFYGGPAFSKVHALCS